MIEICKTFDFCASHCLTHLRQLDHPCRRLHGHNYRVEVVLAGEDVDDRGFLVDYHEMDPLRDWINANLDHRHLNEVLGDSRKTTAENLAKHIYLLIKSEWGETWGRFLHSVTVRETAKTYSRYSELSVLRGEQ